MSEKIVPLSIPEISGNEWEYVRDCLDQGWVSSVGQYVNRFEEMLAKKVGTKYAVATVNGTAALHVSLQVAGVGEDDEVLVSDLTFIAPVNAVRYCGARPVFIDADPVTWQMDSQRVVDFLERECQWSKGILKNRRSGRQVKGILPVSILGHPVDMDPILQVAKKYQLAVIEDATESLGAKYKGRMVGGIADLGCFSFNGNKLITTGGGGMIVTNRQEWADRARYLTTQAKDSDLEYIHNEVGYNYRLTNVLAAIGCAQMERLDEFVAAKRLIAKTYTEYLGKIPGVVPLPEAPWAFSSFWLYTVLFNQKDYGLSCREVMKELGSRGIQTRPLWQPNHVSPAHKGSQAISVGVAENLYDRGLSLPCSVGLPLDKVERVADAITQIQRN